MTPGHTPEVPLFGRDAARRILLVEDNPLDAELTLRALKRANIANAVDIVEDGVQALEYLMGPRSDATRGRAILPVVMLLDLQLPRMDGLEVLIRVREDERLKDLPVIIMTSSQDQEDLLQSYSLGAKCFVRKPLDFGPFRQAVSQLGISLLLVS